VAQPGSLVAAGVGNTDHVARSALHAVGGGEHVGEVRVTRRLGGQVEADPGMAGLDAEHAVQAEALAQRTTVGSPNRRDAGADFSCRQGKLMQLATAGRAPMPHRRADTLLAAEVDRGEGADLHGQPSMRAASWNQRVR
jgi:hypothetical protein